MNKVLEYLRTRPLSFWLRIVAIILVIIPIGYTASLAGSIPEYPAAIAFMVLAAITEILLFVFPKNPFTDYIAIAGVVFLALAFSFFALGGVLSVSDYIAGVNFWGDRTQFPAIMAYGALLLASTCLGTANCFLKD